MAGSYSVDDPATGAAFAEAPDMTVEEARAAIDAAAAASAAWRRTDPGTRAAVLRVAADHLAAREDTLVELAVHDTGARRPVAVSTHVRASIERLRTWAAWPAASLRLPDPPEQGGLHSRVTRAPVGVVGCISPYNFPLFSMVGKVAPALFAGNAVVMKPAPQDPLLIVELTAALRAGLMAAGQSPDLAALVVGESQQLGAAVVAHPAVRAVSFTGSTAVGEAISVAAAPSLKRLLLELGGKGALIARADADVAAVVASVLRTWTIQAGQVCLTPARLIAHESIHQDVVDALRGELARLRMGDPAEETTTVGPVISAVQRSRVEHLIGTARDQGCRVEQHGTVPAKGYFVAPTLVTECGAANTIMQEEVFGPVLCVTRARDDAAAVDIANSTRYGLYDYIFSADADRAADLATELQSAQVSINSTQRNGAAPFGGNKGSGYGRSGGTYALDAYTTVQTVSQP